ncbi:MAG: metallophosphoesterase [Myxococcota bacterium]
MNGEIRFAHLSDWHATTLAGGGLARFRGKRISGWASWALNRRRHHDPAILEAAIRDVRAQAVDRVLVTGDLTHISLPQEFEVAAAQLATLGSPEEVFLVPGNHDCYVRTDPARTWDHWAPYLRGSTAPELPASLAAVASPAPAEGRAPTYADYPTLRVHDRLAVIGLCSSIPTPIFVAGGELGETQRIRLEALLSALGREGFFRVVLIHHPIAAGSEPARRALWDGDALRDILARTGAELVLHGHKHRRRLRTVPGPDGEVPIIGVPSSSEVGSKPDKRAQYHLYRVRDDDGAFRLEAEIRGYDAERRVFAPIAESLFD